MSKHASARWGAQQWVTMDWDAPGGVSCGQETATCRLIGKKRTTFLGFTPRCMKRKQKVRKLELTAYRQQ